MRFVAPSLCLDSVCPSDLGFVPPPAIQLRSKMVSFIDFTRVLSQTLVTVSPACILFGLAKTTRNAVYVPLETLYLLILGYGLSCSTLPWQELFSGWGIHLLGLCVTAFLVRLFQFKLKLPLFKPLEQTMLHLDSDSQHDDDLTGSLTQGQPTIRMPQEWVKVNFIILGTIFLSLLLIGAERIGNWNAGRANKTFASDLFDFSPLTAACLQLNGMMFLYHRAIILRKAAPRPNLELGLSEEESRNRLQLPTFAWAFILASELGESGTIPWLIMKLRHPEEGEADQLDKLATIAACHLALLTGFLVKYHFRTPRGTL